MSRGESEWGRGSTGAAPYFMHHPGSPPPTEAEGSSSPSLTPPNMGLVQPWPSWPVGDAPYAHRCRGPPQVSTCSLVVRPRVTSTTWKPVRPMTGMKKRPATHMTAMLAR